MENSLEEAISPTAITSPISRLNASSEADADGTSPSSRPSENKLSSTSTSSTQGSETALVLACPDCPDKPTFKHRHQYNRHRKSHDRPAKCKIGECRQSFAWKRDLERHIASKHPQATRHAKFFCPYPSCDRARDGTRGGFPRNDTLTRHLRTHEKRG
ncbi:hypothetical protein EPUS_05468 [Endocarpon pusillum Z07020]|uniref:C2H2-type domain-containing protein n=1 Tax=Endocarpon pusillum (strain Z07020 / HMAS-L-300199) TaxID=1263415 RepID=U1HLP0_ENDPU|nr:uncharacterized protein EPUS_05468 [Endocarpon pusillum Z07020]ERF69924.1 hypothetical protein EPUS_05468 [Endocarpon pusillum Z07020]